MPSFRYRKSIFSNFAKNRIFPITISANTGAKLTICPAVHVGMGKYSGAFVRPPWHHLRRSGIRIKQSKYMVLACERSATISIKLALALTRITQCNFFVHVRYNNNIVFALFSRHIYAYVRRMNNYNILT